MLLIVSLMFWGAACDQGGAAPDDPLPPPIESTTTTAPSYDVPAVIDAAYAQRVMQALDHVYGEAVRTLAKSRRVDEEFLRPLVAIHNPRIFQLVQDLWVKVQADDFRILSPTPADPRTRIDRLVRADRECIVIEGDRDVTPLTTADQPLNHHRFVALTPLRPDRNPDRLNPTPWTLNYFGRSAELPEDACVAQ